MSGIYGAWQPIVALKDTKDFSKLSSWNKAYGNVWKNVHAENNAFLGCSYEKLSDTAPTSTPVLHKNGKYAVIDAVLYNKDEIITKGQFPATLSDEELIFDYIEKFGFDELKIVNGDFAGAIYDAEKGTFTLFRDHMGVRPLFYYMSEQSLAFSTDIRGLISMQSTDVAIDETWLYSTLSGASDLNTESTEFAHIHCVKPASYITFTLNNSAIESRAVSYWQPGSKKIRLSSETAYMERLRELITDSISRRLGAISGLVGAELSGGLDSSIIDILIHRLGREALYVSWSASPEEIPYAENDERFIVEDICKQENFNCHYLSKYLRFSDDNLINTKMRELGMEPDMHSAISRRYVFPPYINTLQIAQVAEYVNSHGAKVVFTGHSGDEGVSHRCNPYELFYNREYYHYLKYMWDSTAGGKHRFYNTFLRIHKNLSTSAKKLRNPFVSPFEANGIIKKEFFDKYASDKGAPLTFAYDPLSYVKSGGSRNRLDVVALLGAYCGVRYIAPYIDYRVIDYALSIPRHMYLKNQKNRYIFKETFKDIMPESLYTLTGKEDTSWRSVEKKEKDPTEYLESKKRLVGMLDKAYWDTYLNWESINQWVSEPLDKSDGTRDFAMNYCIDNCLSFQNLITFSRAIEPKE